MKTLKIKRFKPTSVFKAVVMAVAIPFIILLSIVFLAVLLGATIGDSPERGIAAIFTIIPFAIVPIFYGLIFMLMAASYNWLAPKFGGLELDLDEENNKNIEL